MKIFSVILYPTLIADQNLRLSSVDISNPFSLIFPLLILSFMSLVFILLYKSYRRASSYLDIEKEQIELGNPPIFTAKCGGRFDHLNMTAPFVRLSVYQSFIVVRRGFNMKKTGEIILKFNEIKGFEDYSVTATRLVPALGQGIKISHDKKDLPEKIILWLTAYQKTKALELVKSRLEK